ncbi:efflux RND transporter periplasmic adaptor subunit [Aestuariispira insulae]|uniref:RND family efflux transporter MFP subunit n=1 Tax=Aestuariispira insulae TaxID=1461337 RepID=A0A3D9HW90_9PROT|nr:efflux RND transporter periplasmic adaptor subunit [Aestuariispira insulae]RED53680.1 RND family efflux transporter MFP subunit [Aestuariispira insulae]
MLSKIDKKYKKLLFLPPLLVGVVVLVLAVSNKKQPTLREASETARPVRVLPVQPLDFVPKSLGYGYAEPKKQLASVAEVAGRITYRNPDLLRGRILPAGTLLVEIDPTDYILEVERSEADLISIEAQISEIDTTIANLQESLKIERDLQKLSEKEVERKRKLLKRGAGSQAALDTAETNLLSQRQKIQDLENENRLLPAQRAVLEATKRQNETRLAQAEEDLSRTRIILPFDARIASVAVEEGEYVPVGQQLLEADGIDVSEITAQFALSHFASLMAGERSMEGFDPGRAGEILREFGIEARVRAVNMEGAPVWEARLDRINDAIDSGTRTLGIIVAVDEPYRKAIVGKRPPLVKNLFVEVELRGKAKPGRIVIPYSALHRSENGTDIVYVADGDNRLRHREVKLGTSQGDVAVVLDGLQAGEALVLTDLIPAIEGMLLEPMVDQAAAEKLRQAASGEGEVK